MIYDLDQDRIDELTAAFAAGEARGRECADEYILAECVALRVELEKCIDKRDRIESALLSVFACSSTVFVWGTIAWLVWT